MWLAVNLSEGSGDLGASGNPAQQAGCKAPEPVAEYFFFARGDQRFVAVDARKMHGGTLLGR